jgi:hypothetical protein
MRNVSNNGMDYIMKANVLCILDHDPRTATGEA